jgi:hypothetical protein
MAIASRSEPAALGRTEPLVRSVFKRRRKAAVIATFKDGLGHEHVGSIGVEEVTRAMTKANHKVFGPDGAQWHDDPEVAAYQRLLLEDSPAGAVRRRNLVNGVGPAEFVTTTPEAARAKQRLVEMARRKDGLTTQTNYLGKIDQATYNLVRF